MSDKAAVLQRTNALNRANTIRRAIKDVKVALADGSITLAEAFANGDCESAKARDILLAVPAIGDSKADRALGAVGARAATRVSSLTARQRTLLVQFCAYRSVFRAGPLAQHGIAAACCYRPRTEDELVEALKVSRADVEAGCVALLARGALGMSEDGRYHFQGGSMSEDWSVGRGNRQRIVERVYDRIMQADGITELEMAREFGLPHDDIAEYCGRLFLDDVVWLAPDGRYHPPRARDEAAA